MTPQTTEYDVQNQHTSLYMYVCSCRIHYHSINLFKTCIIHCHHILKSHFVPLNPFYVNQSNLSQLLCIYYL